MFMYWNSPLDDLKKFGFDSFDSYNELYISDTDVKELKKIGYCLDDNSLYRHGRGYYYINKN